MYAIRSYYGLAIDEPGDSTARWRFRTLEYETLPLGPAVDAAARPALAKDAHREGSMR